MCEPICILGVKVHPWTLQKLHQEIEAVITGDDRALVLNVNVHCLNLAYERPWLRDFLNEAEIVFCDGAGVMLGARILGHRIPERITYANWIWQFADFGAQHGYSFYFLGARQGVAAAAAARLSERFPKLQIVGTHHGYFDRTYGSEEGQRLISQINALQPTVLVLGFGMPLQEQWLMENWHQLQVNIALTGGAVFDYVSGELRRGPSWLTDHGFEWLARLLIEPRRLWRRYVVGNPIFLWRVFKQKRSLSKQ